MSRYNRRRNRVTSSATSEYEKLQLNRQIKTKEAYIADLEKTIKQQYAGDGRYVKSLQRQIERHHRDIEKLGLQTGAGTITPKEGITKFKVSAAQDRMMGQGLFDLLSPNGVSLLRDSGMGRGDTAVSEYSADSQLVYTSSKSRWVDDLIAVQRAKHAPTLPVVSDLLGKAMGEVWKAVEEASAVHRQANYTLSPKIVREQKKWLARREVKSLEHAITNAALGLPQANNTWVESNASIIKTVVEAASVSSNSQDDTLEMLWELAYWIGCELGLVDDVVPEPIGCGQGENTQNTEEGTDYEDEQDSTDSDATDEAEDSSEGTDFEEDSDGDGNSTEDDSDGEADDGDGEQDDRTNQEKQGEQKEVSGGTDASNGASGDILQKILDSVEPQQQTDKGDPVKFEPEDHLEHWRVVDAATTPISQSFRTQMVLDDFRGRDESEDSFYGEPQADILHELRIGNLEVFEDDARTQGEIVVIVDCSGSMGHWCEEEGRKAAGSLEWYPHDWNSSGWLAWQLAGAIHSQFTDAHVVGYSSASYYRSDSTGTIETSLPNGVGSAGTVIVPVAAGHRPACSCEGGSVLGGGTPEAGALLYLSQKVRNNFEDAVGIIICDGQPQNPRRSFELTHAMKAGGMRFGVISIGGEDYSNIYPADITHSVETESDLFKLAEIFQFIAQKG
jgi:hypothetical protein